MLYLLAAILLMGLVALAALGVEDEHFRSNYAPGPYQASPMVEHWEEGLPGKPVLSWSKSITNSESE